MECWAIAAFRPGWDTWPFGRRPPSRDGNDGPRAGERVAGAYSFTASIRIEPIEASFPPVTPRQT